MNKNKRKPTIGICAVKVPFLTGGAEILCRELLKQIKDRGIDADILEVPFGWWPPESIIPNAAAWRMLDLTTPEGKPIDLLITTKFPSYLVKHPNKVAWLFHQMRELYDFDLAGSDIFTKGLKDKKIRDRLIEMDSVSLGEHKKAFTISRNVSERLLEFNGIGSQALYPPPKLTGRYKQGGYGDFILSVGRLDPWKRTDLLIEGLAIAKAEAKAVIIGTGSDEKRLGKLVKKLGLSNKVRFIHRVSDDDLIDYYSSCRAVFFAPKDEDYGFITIEAFMSAKPVITALDAGGPTEFVEHMKNGFLSEPDPKKIAESIDYLWDNPQSAPKLGNNGLAIVKDISWDKVFEDLIYPYL